MTWLVLLATILGSVVGSSQGTFSRIRVPPDFGCSDGRKYGLFHHRDMSACKGLWQGHVIEATHLCSRGWHVCNQNDSARLSSIGYYGATHINGCYAINAARGRSSCQECNRHAMQMIGIGADCPKMDEDVDSCLGKGIVISNFNSTFTHIQPCGYAPWISGVVCCHDTQKGSAPLMKSSPDPNIHVPMGTKVILKCKSVGDPPPTITWYKNGYPVSDAEMVNEAMVSGNVVLSKLKIPRASRDLDGLYLCRAENNKGFAVSYSSEVTSFSMTSKVAGCRMKQKQVLLHGGAVAACRGKWRGSVKKASLNLCGRGWAVCGVKDREVLNKLSWEEVTSLSGCYAYDAATSDNFDCTKCSHKRKGNRMSGFGSDCGKVDPKASSCLRSGRIDVWRSAAKSNRSLPKGRRNSCSFKRGITTGVMCCKVKDPVKKRRGRPCSVPCQVNSHCDRRGVCRCNSKYKLVRGVCRKRRRSGRKCAQVLCLNGGRCRRGYCICTPPYTGTRCEEAIQSQSIIR